jgi:hypothetical protein
VLTTTTLQMGDVHVGDERHQHVEHHLQDQRRRARRAGKMTLGEDPRRSGEDHSHGDEGHRSGERLWARGTGAGVTAVDGEAVRRATPIESVAGRMASRCWQSHSSI